MPTVAIVKSEMSLHAGQAKKLLRGQMIIVKVTLERAQGVILVLVQQNRGRHLCAKCCKGRDY